MTRQRLIPRKQYLDEVLLFETPTSSRSSQGYVAAESQACSLSCAKR